MVVRGVDGGTVTAHGNTGQAKPLPHLIEVAGCMYLIVEHGNGVLRAFIIDDIVNTGMFD